MSQDVSKKTIRGKVVSDKMDKTIVVSVERAFIHPLLKKVVKKNKKFKAHDENNIAKVGNIVDIYEGKPVSKLKYMYLDKVVSEK